jgi:hypothetical protein
MSIRSSIPWVLLIAACGEPKSEGAKPQPPAPQPPAARPDGPAAGVLVFAGMCDASGAVPLDAHRFLVADDEDNILRIYDTRKPGPPVESVDIGSGLELPLKGKKQPKYPETDLEAATRLGDRALWVTSHGRSSSGKQRPERLRMFATTTSGTIAVTGTVYSGLLEDLLAEPRLARFGLQAAAQLAPKAPGGFNLEGMTATPAGGVIIGFRNPLHEGRALIIPLDNPADVIAGGKPRFGEPVLLDLGGRGVRSLSSWRGRYLIAAGSPTSAAEPGPALYTWDGNGAPGLATIDVAGLNPEAFFTPEESERIMLLSDDGSLPIDGTECKSLKDPARKRFRAAWVSIGA